MKYYKLLIGASAVSTAILGVTALINVEVISWTVLILIFGSMNIISCCNGVFLAKVAR